MREMAIDSLADIVHLNAVEHGFHDPNQSEGDFLAHMCCNKHGEVSELYEAWRAGNLHGPCDKATKMKQLGLRELTCAEEEMADIIIRVLDECRRLGIDIAMAVGVKHAYKTTRPFKHGKQT